MKERHVEQTAREPLVTRSRFYPEHWLIPVIVIALAAWYETSLRRVTGSGFPLDDAWIHLQFARNLAHGEFFTFNPGDPAAGLTAPLWAVVLAVPSFFAVDPIVSTKLIGIVLTIAGAVLSARLATEVSGLRLAGAIAGVALASSSRLIWGAMSGMEGPLYVALAAATCLVFVRTRQLRSGSAWGALAGLAGAARPELFLFFPILFIAALPDLKDPVRRRSLLLACVWFAIFAGSFVLINLLTDGRPLPNTFYAKTGTRGLFNAVIALDLPEVARAFTAGALNAWNLVFQFTTSQSLILATGVLVGALVMLGVLGKGARGGGVLVVLLVFMPMLTGLFAPQPPILSQQGRYVGHLVLLHFVAASVGIAWLAEQVTNRGRRVVLLIVVVALGRMLTTSVRDSQSYASQVHSINHMQLGAAEWVKTHAAPDALVATNDIGAMAYFSGRRVLDTYGLVTPEIIEYRRSGNIVPFLEERRPAFVIVYPEWHPEIPARPDLFEEVHRFTISPRVVAPADSFVVYATHWQ